MKCPRCSGSGEELKYFDGGDHFGAGTSPSSKYYSIKCTKCNGTGEVKMTNKVEKITKCEHCQEVIFLGDKETAYKNAQVEVNSMSIMLPQEVVDARHKDGFTDSHCVFPKGYFCSPRCLINYLEELECEIEDAKYDNDVEEDSFCKHNPNMELSYDCQREIDYICKKERNKSKEKEYIIVQATHSYYLEQFVNEKIFDGWKPVGGAFIGNSKDVPYKQTMIKESKTNNTKRLFESAQDWHGNEISKWTCTCIPRMKDGKLVCTCDER